MTTAEQQSIQSEINRLEAENMAMNLKIGAVGMTGAIIGVIYANKQGSRFWGKFGYWIAGGAIAGLPLRLMYTKKLMANDAEIKNLKAKINQ